MGPYDTEGMPTDEAAPSEAQTDESDDSTEEQETGAEGVTALLPKSICPGMEPEPDQILKFKVVKTYEDEIEVKYVKGEEGSDMDRSEEQLNAMAEVPPA